MLVITWVGHTSFLVQIGGKNILLDPVWSDRASPVPFAGPRRWVPPAIPFNALPPIDLVVISHDHYDHLDLKTVRRLVRSAPQAHWIAPLKVGAWLRKRGANVFAELDWWQATTLDGLTITCTPAQHFSGRSLTNRNGTLWGGWTIRSATHTLFFAGDTGRPPGIRANRPPTRPIRRRHPPHRRLRASLVHAAGTHGARRNRVRLHQHPRRQR